ncbi:purine-nucleoside phosphorylase [Vagococcus xieshaowenii]|uniref:Purine nucleoside phosphorylase n=1 Tax=Vagococcus xieshaowenii TaxID=2562451 RepID=A0AAJ5JLN2_9ENTE|nr:purine-nucleoside phosphorylase [Vagococcus xieshaowenii]QCA29535.1 purine-nucleoside phosphorylase [Vagococcus xieshaowenii]TFZ42651.1 purine-nucleoside phosphorylase [Vagococcus xieshaowenii]
MNKKLSEQLKETAAFIKDKGVGAIDFGMILGSGLGELADEIANPIVIPYEEIPNFPVSTVVGHAGQLVYGTLSGKNVLAMQGRFHFYEGHSMQTVTFPVRVMNALGAHSMIVTNAAGGCNTSFTPGNLMLIQDHINFTGDNPLIGENEEDLGPRFPDMSEAYDKEYGKIVREVATDLKIMLQQGVYMGFSGPTYETPAEVKMARILGADAVGMSTVPEVIVARHMGMRVLGISCITNLAAGMQANLNHDEVVETTERVKEEFKSLVKLSLEKL